MITSIIFVLLFVIHFIGTVLFYSNPQDHIHPYTEAPPHDLFLWCVKLSALTIVLILIASIVSQHNKLRSEKVSHGTLQSFKINCVLLSLAIIYFACMGSLSFVSKHEHNTFFYFSMALILCLYGAHFIGNLSWFAIIGDRYTMFSLNWWCSIYQLLQLFSFMFNTVITPWIAYQDFVLINNDLKHVTEEFVHQLIIFLCKPIITILTFRIIEQIIHQMTHHHHDKDHDKQRSLLPLHPHQEIKRIQFYLPTTTECAVFSFMTIACLVFGLLTAANTNDVQTAIARSVFTVILLIHIFWSVYISFILLQKSQSNIINFKTVLSKHLSLFISGIGFMIAIISGLVFNNNDIVYLVFGICVIVNIVADCVALILLNELYVDISKMPRLFRTYGTMSICFYLSLTFLNFAHESCELEEVLALDGEEIEAHSNDLFAALSFILFFWSIEFNLACIERLNWNRTIINALDQEQEFWQRQLTGFYGQEQNIERTERDHEIWRQITETLIKILILVGIIAQIVHHAIQFWNKFERGALYWIGHIIHQAYTLLVLLIPIINQSKQLYKYKMHNMTMQSNVANGILLLAAIIYNAILGSLIFYEDDINRSFMHRYHYFVSAINYFLIGIYMFGDIKWGKLSSTNSYARGTLNWCCCIYLIFALLSIIAKGAIYQWISRSDFEETDAFLLSVTGEFVHVLLMYICQTAVPLIAFRAMEQIFYQLFASEDILHSTFIIEKQATLNMMNVSRANILNMTQMDSYKQPTLDCDVLTDESVVAIHNLELLNNFDLSETVDAIHANDETLEFELIRFSAPSATEVIILGAFALCDLIYHLMTLVHDVSWRISIWLAVKYCVECFWHLYIIKTIHSEIKCGRAQIDNNHKRFVSKHASLLISAAGLCTYKISEIACGFVYGYFACISLANVMLQSYTLILLNNVKLQKDVIDLMNWNIMSYGIFLAMVHGRNLITDFLVQGYNIDMLSDFESMRGTSVYHAIYIIFSFWMVEFRIACIERLLFEQNE